MRWAGPVSRRSRQTIITQKKMGIKISQRLWACSSICSGGSFSCFVCNYLRLKNDTDFLLIPDVLLNGLNFMSLHGPLVSLRGLKKMIA